MFPKIFLTIKLRIISVVPREIYAQVLILARGSKTEFNELEWIYKILTVKRQAVKILTETCGYSKLQGSVHREKSD